jgi:hypothetical protein
VEALGVPAVRGEKPGKQKIKWSFIFFDKLGLRGWWWRKRINQPFSKKPTQESSNSEEKRPW